MQAAFLSSLRTSTWLETGDEGLILMDAHLGR